MGYEVGMALFVVLVIGLLISFRKLARKNKFFRRFWNDNMKFSSHLPFGSLFARLIIADSDEEKSGKGNVSENRRTDGCVYWRSAG